MFGLESTNAFRSNERNLLAISWETTPSITSCNKVLSGHHFEILCKNSQVGHAYSNHTLDKKYSGSPPWKSFVPSIYVNIISTIQFVDCFQLTLSSSLCKSDDHMEPARDRQRPCSKCHSQLHFVLPQPSIYLVCSPH